jgi:hypothetical protein
MQGKQSNMKHMDQSVRAKAGRIIDSEDEGEARLVGKRKTKPLRRKAIASDSEDETETVPTFLSKEITRRSENTSSIHPSAGLPNRTAATRTAYMASVDISSHAEVPATKGMNVHDLVGRKKIRGSSVVAEDSTLALANIRTFMPTTLVKGSRLTEGDVLPADESKGEGARTLAGARSTRSSHLDQFAASNPLGLPDFVATAQNILGDTGIDKSTNGRPTASSEASK